MSVTIPPAAENNSAEAAPPPSDTSEVGRNGNAAPGTAPGTDGGPKPQSEQERAEAIVERVAERITAFASTVWGKGILTLAARAREVAQDFWADVQDVRHGRRP
jgi:hypothetical protein